MSKLYRVIDNTDVWQYNIKVGDCCTLVNRDDCDEYCAWFKNDNWTGDGIWCLSWNMVKEIN